MAFKNPFTRYKEVNDQNYLRISVVNFLELQGKPEPFYDAISELVHIREGLRVAEQGGLLSQISGKEFYKLAIQWLNLNLPITQGVAVSEITNYDDINDAIANSFLQYVQWLKNNYLANNSLYQQIQAQIGVQKVQRLQKLDLAVEQVEKDFRESLQKSQEELSRASDRQQESLNTSLTNQFNSQKEQITQARDEALNSIQQAQALEAWKDYYQENVELYERQLCGRKSRSIDTKGRYRTFVNQFTNRLHNYKKHRNNNPGEKIVKLGKYLVKGLLSLVYYFITRTIK